MSTRARAQAVAAEGMDWIEALNQAVLETDSLDDFDNLQLWWTETVKGVAEEIRCAMCQEEKRC